MTKKTKRSAKDYASKSKKRLIKVADLKNLRKIRDNVAGIDVGAEEYFVAAPDPKFDKKIAVNRFGSFTANLRECVDWLLQCNIQSVAMEATGVYWMTLESMLVKAGIEVVLINARDFKKMKDKKTDVCDAEYLQLYHSYGLLEGSFIPEGKIKELRTILRLREQHVMGSATAIQRMQKALIRMNLRLDNVLSDISGSTGMSIINAILRGERDPKILAKYRDTRCKKTEAEIEDSLNGFYQEDQLFALKQALEQHQFFLLQISQCDLQIQKNLSEFDSATVDEKNEIESPRIKKKIRVTTLRPHEFSFDLRQELIRITGTDLTRLPGIGLSTALTLISEIGLDMTRWKSAKHFVSWLRLAPNNKISGGKILRNKSKQGKNRAAIALRMGVSGLYRENNDTALGAFVRIKKAKIGAPKAITAGANKLARMLYMTLLTGKPFEEYGSEAYLATQKVKYLRKIRKTIAPWGYEIKQKEVA